MTELNEAEKLDYSLLTPEGKAVYEDMRFDGKLPHVLAIKTAIDRHGTVEDTEVSALLNGEDERQRAQKHLRRQLAKFDTLKGMEGELLRSTSEVAAYLESQGWVWCP